MFSSDQHSLQFFHLQQQRHLLLSKMRIKNLPAVRMISSNPYQGKILRFIFRGKSVLFYVLKRREIENALGNLTRDKSQSRNKEKRYSTRCTTCKVAHNLLFNFFLRKKRSFVRLCERCFDSDRHQLAIKLWFPKFWRKWLIFVHCLIFPQEICLISFSKLNWGKKSLPVALRQRMRRHRSRKSAAPLRLQWDGWWLSGFIPVFNVSRKQDENAHRNRKT